MTREAAYGALIRLKGMRADDLRKEIARLEEERDDLVRARRALEARAEAEKDLAGKAGPGTDGLAGWSHGAFVQRVIAEGRALEARVRDLDEEIEGVREALRAAFLEKKQLELIEAQRAARDQALRARAEAAALDEAALQAHRRNRF